MKANIRWIVLAIVLLAVGIVMAFPYINPENKAPDEFQLTENPAAKLEQALSEGRPVFLEFYAYT